MLPTAPRSGLDVTLSKHPPLVIDPSGRAQNPAPEGTGGAVNPDLTFTIPQPPTDCAVRLARQVRSFAPDTLWPTAADFERRSQALLARVAGDPAVANLLNGPHLPFCLPRHDVTDYGTSLEAVFLPAAQRAYRTELSGRHLRNNREGQLAGAVTVVAEGHHHRLIEVLRRGPSVAVLFLPFQGFSVPTVRQLMSGLPEDFVLSGAIDVMTGLTAYPDVLARDFKTPGLDCAANGWRASQMSMLFKAYDERAYFGDSPLYAHERCGAGVLLLDKSPSSRS